MLGRLLDQPWLDACRFQIIVNSSGFMVILGGVTDEDFYGWVGVSLFWGLIGSKKPLPVKMNQMRRRVGDPYLGLPCNVGEVAGHDVAVRESGHIDKPGF